MARSHSSHSSRNRLSRRRKGGLLRKVLLASTAVVIPAVLLGAGGYYALQQANAEKITANYCFPRSDQYAAAFFVDFSHTQDTSGSQRRDLRNALYQLYERLPANGKIAVFTTAQDGSATINKPEFVLCKPPTTNAELERIGAPSGGSEIYLGRQNEEARAVFDARVDDLLARSVQTDQQAGYSPILEQVRGISRYEFGAPLSHLSIYTDGVNNSPIARFCSVQGHLPSFDRFTLRTDYAREIAPDSFAGASVDILLVEAFVLPSPGAEFCTHREVRDFWTDYFEAHNASPVRLTPLVYGTGS